MNAVRLLACVLLCHAPAYAALAEPRNLEPAPLTSAAEIKSAGDRLARCAGTYRGAAEVMRKNGREHAASYADAVGTGALFAAWLLFTAPAAVEANVLRAVDPNVHIEALAWGSERNFVMMDAQAEPGAMQAFKACRETASLQSSVLRGALPLLASTVP
jgi:hypothetical protein